MAHIRTQIRDAAVAALTGLATTGANVFKSRTLALDDGSGGGKVQIPGLLIYTKDEDSELAAMGGDSAPLERAVELVIVPVGAQTASEDLDDLLDRIAVEVEVAVAANRKWGGLAKDTVLESSKQDLSGSGETDQGMLVMTFTVQCFTARNNPETAI